MPPRVQSRAEEAKTRAETAKLEAELEKLRAETRKASAEADQAEMDLAEAKRKEQRALAADAFHHVYLFGSKVDESSVRSCIKQLSEWARLEPGCAIEIIFDSPGGSVIDGMHLFDRILSLRSAGHYVTTTALGMAASMAGILLQAGDKRVMGSESYLLIHEVAAGAMGKIGEIEDEVELLKMMQRRVVAIFAARSKLSAKVIANRMRRRDWWLDADSALKEGLIDEIRGLSAPKRRKAS